MARHLRLIAAACVFSCLMSFQSSAIIGVGAHWGFDLSLSLDNELNMPIAIDMFEPKDFLSTFPGVTDTIAGIPIDTVFTLLGDAGITEIPTPLTLSRTGWQRTIINFGGKAYIDIIPIIDAIEISMNFGVWEYEGVIRYPKGIDENANPSIESLRGKSPTEIYESLLTYDSLALTLENFADVPWFFGVSKTPYGKFKIDATIRKNIIKLAGKKIKIYAGGGPSVHFATPVLSVGFVKKALAETLEQAAANADKMTEILENEEMMKKVLIDLVESFNVPRFGMHLVLGSHIKLPVIPVGFYGDAKLMIPFDQMDDDVELRGFGPMFNVGITVGI